MYVYICVYTYTYIHTHIHINIIVIRTGRRTLAKQSGLDYAIMSGGDLGPLGHEASAIYIYIYIYMYTHTHIHIHIHIINNHTLPSAVCSTSSAVPFPLPLLQLQPPLMADDNSYDSGNVCYSDLLSRRRHDGLGSVLPQHYLLLTAYLPSFVPCVTCCLTSHYPLPVARCPLSAAICYCCQKTKSMFRPLCVC